MYAVYAVEPCTSSAAINTLRPFGSLTYLRTVYGGDWGWNFEIWELEFDTLDPRLVPMILHSLDSYSMATHFLTEVLETDCPELHKAIRTPEPTRPSLSWCVQRYLMYFPDSWRESLTASGQCAAVSHDFFKFLLAKGAVSREEAESGYVRVVTRMFGDRRYESPDFPRECHVVIQVGCIVLDFTRRQYDGNAPVPTVWINRTGEDQVFPPCEA